MPIKERLKRVQGYQVEGCGLWCHALLVFKQCLVSIKAVFMSTSGVSIDPASGVYDDSHIHDFINSFHINENNLPS